MKLFCAVDGVEESVFPVAIDIDTEKTVGHLKEVIASKLTSTYTGEPKYLKLFLAKKADGGWLPDDEDLDKMLQNNVDTSKMKKLRASWKLNKKGLFGSLGEDVVHVLVVVPKGAGGSVGEVSKTDQLVRNIEKRRNARVEDELRCYQERGHLIRTNCATYCERILATIDLYAAMTHRPLPFICVEGSSGMGKTQLAFALEGERPWFYWIATTLGVNSQDLYTAFSTISDYFSTAVLKDLQSFYEQAQSDNVRIRNRSNAILNSMSSFYDGELWTYGFIRALLEYSALEENQHAHMIRFDKKMSIREEKCSLNAVIAVRDNIEKEKKKLPFFILDGISSNADDMNLAAFQRNVFRVCGLVVVVMGTDTKSTNFVGQSGNSYGKTHTWMTVVSRFPPLQPTFKEETHQAAWDSIERQYPVVKSIAEGSRGRFSRYFVDSLVEYATCHTSYNLCELLDYAFGVVSVETQGGKRFMQKQSGVDAQLMAISYPNAEIELPPAASESASGPPQKKRRIDVGGNCMNLHFANLVDDDQLTEVTIADGSLTVNRQNWRPLCRFPTVEEDLLLYLAVLGGKTYSGYYDHTRSQAHSVREIFVWYLKGKQFPIDRNGNAAKNDFEAYENMVSHMIFCSSRRHGVEGIRFNDFFAALLGEFQDKFKAMVMTDGATQEMTDASKLIAGYPALAKLLEMRIPFLAPPKAVWPESILATREHGCNFGHFVRPPDKSRCDVYVQDMKDPSGPPLFVCECKHWSRSVGIGTIRSIVKDLNAVWETNWSLVILFCVKLADLQNWEHPTIGCVKIDCKTACTEWVNQPAETDREKLIIVLETGSLIAVPVQNG